MPRRLVFAPALALALVVLWGPERSLAVPPTSPRPPDPVGVWPLTPEHSVLSGFSPPDLPWGSGHRGVDLAGIPGQSVRAALAGTIRYAGRLAGRGVVVVDHGETRTTYEPVTSELAVGSAVEAGQPLGTLDLAGGHCLPRACLHWGLLRGETYLDPLTLVGAGPVRLLPLWRTDPAPPSVAAPSNPAARPAVPGRGGVAAPPATEWRLAALAVRLVLHSGGLV